MDSINFFKGYGRLDHGQVSQKSTKRPLIITIITISAILLLTVIACSMFIASVQSSNTESSTQLSSNSANSIKTVCNVTQHSDSCFTAISSLNTSPNPDPELIFKLSLQASITELSNITSFLQTLTSDPNSNGTQPDSALLDCRSLFEDALGRLNDSMSAMEVGPGKKALTEGKIKDIQTWVSGAMTDQDTCLDGLEEMESTVLVEVKSKVQKFHDYISNTLAIVANIHALREKFNIKV